MWKSFVRINKKHSEVRSHPRGPYSYGISYKLFTLCKVSALKRATDELTDFLESTVHVELFERGYFEQRLGNLAIRRNPHHQLQVGDLFEFHLPIHHASLNVLSPTVDGTGTNFIFRIHILLGYISKDGHISGWALVTEGNLSTTHKGILFR